LAERRPRDCDHQTSREEAKGEIGALAAWIDPRAHVDLSDLWLQYIRCPRECVTLLN